MFDNACINGFFFVPLEAEGADIRPFFEKIHHFSRFSESFPFLYIIFHGFQNRFLFCDSRTKIERFSHASRTHYARVTHASCTHYARITHAFRTHHARIMHVFCTYYLFLFCDTKTKSQRFSHALRTSHASRTHHARVTHASRTHHARITHALRTHHARIM